MRIEAHAMNPGHGPGQRSQAQQAHQARHSHEARRQEEGSKAQGHHHGHDRGGERERGVIRNLLEGHFKGVADLRLRMNFAGELAGLEQRGIDQALEPHREDLEALRADLAPLVELTASDGPRAAEIGGAAEWLDMELEVLLTGEGGKARLQAGLTRIQEAFENLKGLLQAAIDEGAVEPTPDQAAPPEEAPPAGQEPPAEATAPVVDPTGEPAPPPADAEAAQEPAASAASGETPPAPQEAPPADEEPPADPAPSLDLAGLAAQFLGQWDQSIVDLLVDLEDGLDQVRAMPQLSPPEGNGKAYARFLAMYLGAPADESPAEPVPEPAPATVPVEGVDVVV